MKATILQPTYLPWLGYFEMIASSDVYVVFDHVQFERKSWQQRNRIKTSNGIILLTIPVQKVAQETKIADIKISYNQGNFLEKHWKTISLAYKKALYFNKYKSFFEKIYSKKPVLLRDLNVEIIKCICNLLGIKKKVVLSSNLNLNDENMGKTEKVINLCKKLNITNLYDVKGAEEILDKDLFNKEKILITFQDFQHPKYVQLWGEFVPYVSIIDLLFNYGPDSIKYIKQK